VSICNLTNPLGTCQNTGVETYEHRYAYNCVGGFLSYQITLSVRHKNGLPNGDLVFSPADSGWVSIINTGMKSSEGKSVGEVLLDAIEAFPKYDTESAEGTNKAIREMEVAIGEVAGFEERNVKLLQRSCIAV